MEAKFCQYPQELFGRGSAFGDVESEMDIENLDGLFNERGGWDPKPASGVTPRTRSTSGNSSMSWTSVWKKLPPDTARVFIMREVMELKTDEL